MRKVVAGILAVLIFGLWLFTGSRPKTPTYDRFGRVVRESENPDFRETEEERHR